MEFEVAFETVEQMDVDFNESDNFYAEYGETSKGDKGEDGFSPIANVTKTGNTATITITDKIGTTTATVTDGAGVNDHTQLINRNAIDQHPISSITNLQNELDEIETEALSNMEIQAILNS